MDWLNNGLLLASQRGGVEPDPFIANVYYMANYEGTITPEINLGPAGVSTVGTPVLANGGVEFDGAGDYVQTASGCCPAFGSAAFTIEAWIQSNTTVSYGGVVGATGLNWVAALDAYANFQLYTPSTSWVGSGVGIRVGGQKVHIAMSYTPGFLSFYRNGTRMGSALAVNLSTSTGSAMHIGNFSGYYMGGVIYSLRITTGVSRYSGTSYTIPPETFPSI